MTMPSSQSSVSLKEEGDMTVSFSDDRNQRMGLPRSGSGTRNLPTGAAVYSIAHTSADRKRAEEETEHGVFFPWTRNYRAWWAVSLIGSIATIFVETFQIAFVPAGLAPFNDASAIIEYILYAIFLSDIAINFNLAFLNESKEIICDRKAIARNYLRLMFWVDLIGVFPFYLVALAIAGEIGEDSTLAQYLSLLRLFRLVRLHRVKQLFDILQYSPKISLMSLTLIRNFGFALVWTHFNACIMFFISRLHNFNEDETWIGGSIAGLNNFEQYVTSLYWSVVTFTTVGYGDYSPKNAAEQIWDIMYMLLNMVVSAWIIGSITLLIVKNDEKTGAYREILQQLDQYCTLNGFDKTLHKRLAAQIKLHFNNNEINDENVLSHFPTSVRRKILRKLYLPSLAQTSLMKNIRQQFVDAFLAACSVELFSAGEEILQRGSTTSDLYLLVGGSVELRPISSASAESKDESNAFGSIADSEMPPQTCIMARVLNAGEFINGISFFTESPQVDTVKTLTVCKTLTISRSAYTALADAHPGSAGKILLNLLAKVEEIAENPTPRLSLPKRLEVIRAGSVFDTNDDLSNHAAAVQNTVAAVQTSTALATMQDLVRMHIDKQKDDHTTRFLFAAARDDTATIDLMCEQGFDPNNSDYDKRTGLMVAAMKGNTDVVTRILEHNANPNLIDLKGNSALYEAVKNGHESTMEVLIKHGAKLCMDESLAASTLCQTVFDGDILMLRRLLRASIQVNAADYDKRTAAHLAAAEGNVVALKVLVEFGADLTAKDRWNHSVLDEAKRSSSAQLLDYLKTKLSDDN